MPGARLIEATIDEDTVALVDQKLDDLVDLMNDDWNTLAYYRLRVKVQNSGGSAKYFIIDCSMTDDIVNLKLMNAQFTEGLSNIIAASNYDTVISVKAEIKYELGFPPVVRWNEYDKIAQVTLSNENLTANRSGGGTTWAGVRANHGRSDGAWYTEFTVDTINGNTYFHLGVMDGISSLQNWPGEYATGWDFELSVDGTPPFDGRKGNNNSQSSYGDGAAIVPTDIIMMAWKAPKIWWGKNGTWYESGDPATGANPAFTNLSGTLYPVFSGFINFNNTVTANFGGTPFTHTVPTGFRGLDG